METAEQNTKQIMEENEVLKQLIELLNQQDMDGRSQDFMGIFWYVAGMQMQLTAITGCPGAAFADAGKPAKICDGEAHG